MEELNIEHYFTHFKDQRFLNQQYILAELNIKKQANELMNSKLFESYISEFTLEIKGLITSKDKDIFKEIPIEKSNNKIYEL